MKLVFFKEEDEIKLKLNQNNTNEDFNYVKLIEFLHENNELEETEYCAEISEDEKAKINEMIIKINEKIVSSGMD
jgi:hypothetical protein